MDNPVSRWLDGQVTIITGAASGLTPAPTADFYQSSGELKEA